MTESIFGAAGRMRKEGATIDAVIHFLKNSGCTPMETIKIVRDVYAISLGEAKGYVGAHPAFASETAVASELHGEVLKTIDRP